MASQKLQVRKFFLYWSPRKKSNVWNWRQNASFRLADRHAVPKPAHLPPSRRVVVVVAATLSRKFEIETEDEKREISKRKFSLVILSDKNQRRQITPILKNCSKWHQRPINYLSLGSGLYKLIHKLVRRSVVLLIWTKLRPSPAYI